MTKERLMSLEIYRAKVRADLHGPIPLKHSARPLEYKAFLARELKQVDSTLDNARLIAKEEVKK